jgi:hypothetical protein
MATRQVNKKRRQDDQPYNITLQAADGLDKAAEFYRRMEKEDALKKEIWKLKAAAGAPATTMIEPASTQLRPPTTSFMLDMGQCLVFGATCHKCELHTYFWYPEKYASRPHVDLAAGTWTPSYKFDPQYAKCGNCMGDVDTQTEIKNE